MEIVGTHHSHYTSQPISYIINAVNSWFAPLYLATYFEENNPFICKFDISIKTQSFTIGNTENTEYVVNEILTLLKEGGLKIEECGQYPKVIIKSMELGL